MRFSQYSLAFFLGHLGQIGRLGLLGQQGLLGEPLRGYFFALVALPKLPKFPKLSNLPIAVPPWSLVLIVLIVLAVLVRRPPTKKVGQGFALPDLIVND